MNSARAKRIASAVTDQNNTHNTQHAGATHWVFADLPGFPSKLTAVCRLIRVVAAVVLRVTLPPERNALVVLADKLKDAVQKTVSVIK